MWWIPVVAAGALVWAILREDEREAGERWELERDRVQRRVEEHRRNIERHLHEAQSSYDFHLLVDLHFSSFRIADEAYKLVTDARTSLAAIGRMLVACKSEREELKKKLADTNDPSLRSDYKQRLQEIYSLRTKFFDDKDKLTEERDHFRAEVNRLNAQTRTLKEAIRDRCGSRGREWYEKLEERGRARRANRP
jgi:hypothetical protein